MSTAATPTGCVFSADRAVSTLAAQRIRHASTGPSDRGECIGVILMNRPARGDMGGRHIPAVCGRCVPALRSPAMRIQFCGADRTVTGSCHLVEVNGLRLLLDCGMYQ